jgi:hypothetical protein
MPWGIELPTVDLTGLAGTYDFNMDQAPGERGHGRWIGYGRSGSAGTQTGEAKERVRADCHRALGEGSKGELNILPPFDDWGASFVVVFCPAGRQATST